MNLTKLEFKKILRGKIVLIAIIAAMGLNVFTLLVGGSQDMYSAQAPAFRTNIAAIQEQYGYFAGAITDEWTAKYTAEDEAILRDPANRVSEQEQERIKQELRENGVDTDYAEQNLSVYFLTEDARRLHARYEPMAFSSFWYKNAADYAQSLGSAYREKFPGAKGEALAADAENRYNYLAEEYTAYFNYDWGYEKLRNMMTTYPLTIGLVILIALAPLFSNEYSRKTDALILTAKHGKKRLITAKIKAGLLLGVGIWAVITLVNIILVFALYGTAGSEAYWQNWIVDWAPFPWNQGTITVISVITGLVGAVFLSIAVMFISSLSKTPFAAIIAGAIVLLLPMLDFAFTTIPFINRLYCFSPSVVLIGIREWQWFDLAYIFGKAVPVQYLIGAFVAAAGTVAAFVSVRVFRSHQVEN
ncbi:MAG: ABC transporter permease subunit [Oscillospiraceae bacterium]|jgi:ABC-type transport system involved in multi-copper enzyme maturation permease subunit|nr:ABC transporter permease subunit [Oscillospiraceae bacterium]